MERERTRHRDLEDARVACLLIGDEVDTLASDHRLLAQLGRSLERPIPESPFLATAEWHAHKSELARVIDHVDTWKGLTSLYHVNGRVSCENWAYQYAEPNSLGVG